MKNINEIIRSALPAILNFIFGFVIGATWAALW